MFDEFKTGKAKRSLSVRFGDDDVSFKSKCSVSGGGGGGGGNTTTTSSGTTYTTNIPDYARPYVENMLGATQQQLFTSDGSGNLTGFRPYTPYSTNMQDYIAPFSPLQKQAQASAANLSMPQQFQAGTGMVGAGGVGTMATSGQLAGFGQTAQNQLTNPYAQQAYMSPYVQNALQPTLQEMQRQYGITGAQEQAKATAAGAFGGNRQALMQAENQRNKNIAMNQAIGQGYQQAFTQGQAAQQAALGMGLSGLQAAQQGYGQMGQLGTQLGNLGAQKLAAETGIIGAQAGQGAQQQAAQQAMINQAIQNYATAQQYPLMQLGFMSNMLRGLPMQATSTQQYVAAPSPYQQAIGAAGTGASLYGALKAKGGIIEAKKSGGIVGYDVGGKVESILDDMTPDQLKEELQKSSSPSVKKMAARLLAEKSMAGGGIIAFAEGNKDSETVGTAVEKEAPVKESVANLKAPAAPLPEIATRQIGIVPSEPTYQAPGRSPAAIPINLSVQAATPPAQQQAPAQAPAAPAPEAPSRVATAIEKSQAPEYMKEMWRATAEDINKPLEDRYKERKSIVDKMIGPDVAAQEYRAKLMEQRANAADEADRQQKMRFAQFFARWGATPGPMLAAGLNAAKDTVGQLIEDKDHQKKFQQGLDEAIYKIERSDRLEAMGMLDEAMKEDREAKKLTHTIMTSMNDVYKEQQQTARTSMTAGAKESGEDKAKNAADVEVERRIRSEKQRVAAKKEGVTGADLEYLRGLEESVRRQVYKERKIPIPETPTDAPVAPEVVEGKKDALKKTIKENEKGWFSDDPAKKARREAAERELDKLEGRGDNANRKPIESYSK